MNMNRKSLSLCLGIALLACLPLSAQTTYTFQDIKFPGDTFTQLLGINNSDIIAGYHGPTINKGFTYNLATNTFTNENFPGSAQTQVIGINHSSQTVGFYVDNAGKVHGFIDTAGRFTTVDQPGTPFNQLLGQSDNGQAAGYYSTLADGTGPDHAYVFDETGKVFATFTIPGSVSAQATGVNNAGTVCGFTVDAKGVNHGWLLMLGTLKQLNFPGSTGTQALGLNNSNQVVGFYTDAAGNTHGFVHNVLTNTWQSIDDPNGVGTTIVNGINSKGQLVGFWGTSPNNTGFVATPAAQ
jgi:hypothetical protein